MSWAGVKGFGRDAVLALAVAFVAWFLWVQLAMPGPRSSGPAPPLVLPDLAGEEVSLASHGPDEVVVLNFWFTSCPPCRNEIPELTAFHRANPDVALYGVSIDRMDPARLAAVSRRLGVGYPVLHDPHSQVAAAWGVSVYPTTVVVRDGRIRSVRMGEVDRERLAQMVEQAREP